MEKIEIKLDERQFYTLRSLGRLVIINSNPDLIIEINR